MKKCIWCLNNEGIPGMTFMQKKYNICDGCYPKFEKINIGIGLDLEHVKLWNDKIAKYFLCTGEEPILKALRIERERPDYL